MANPLGGALGLAAFKKAAAMTVDEKFKEMDIQDPKLRALLVYDYGNYGLVPGEASWLQHATVCAHYTNGAAYPKGGPKSMAESIIPTIESRGGLVVSKATVEVREGVYKTDYLF